MTDRPKVWNVKDPNCPPDAVYCGRWTNRFPRSIYANPFKIGAVAGRNVTRDMACDRFEREILPTLDVSELRGKDLMCWCKPKRCHCDAILKKANA